MWGTHKCWLCTGRSGRLRYWTVKDTNAQWRCLTRDFRVLSSLILRTWSRITHKFVSGAPIILYCWLDHARFQRISQNTGSKPPLNHRAAPYLYIRVWEAKDGRNALWSANQQYNEHCSKCRTCLRHNDIPPYSHVWSILSANDRV